MLFSLFSLCWSDCIISAVVFKFIDPCLCRIVSSIEPNQCIFIIVFLSAIIYFGFFLYFLLLWLKFHILKKLNNIVEVLYDGYFKILVS